MEDYTIVKKHINEINEFNAEVIALLDAGWELIGGICLSHDDQLLQALAFPTPPVVP